MLEVNVRKKLGNVNIDVNFSTESKGVTALYGQSGAGKTSVINMIAGLVTPDSGYIRFNGKELFSSENKVNIPVHKRAIGYVFQDARLFPNMSVKRNLLYGSKRHSDNSFSHNFDDICSLLGINHLLDRMPSKLSGGEKQRVAIGRAILSNPNILLMDEPLASLDSNRRTELLNYIGVISKGFNLPIIYVTHSAEEILRLAANMVLLEGGHIKKFGKAVTILNEISASQGYGSRDFGVICQGIVTSYDYDTELAVISFGCGNVEVSSPPIDIDSKVRFKIDAIDVVLCASIPPATSVRNVYKGVISDIAERSNRFTDVLVDMGVPIWARISNQSLRDMALYKGKIVYVLVKSAVISAGLIINSPE